MQLAQLSRSNPYQAFPPVNKALSDPNGLLAIGGCLSAPRLLNAYRSGVFPWFNPGEPILWWSPSPRLVLFPSQLHISRSLAKKLRKNEFAITLDHCFLRVMQACAKPRRNEAGTWISPDMLKAYMGLHQQGAAHSIEVWQGRQLVGGLYGVAIGQVFFGESMFHTVADASKVALVYLAQYLLAWGFKLIDCQVRTEHLSSMGAQEIDRQQFMKLLNDYCDLSPQPNAWQLP